MIFRSLAVAPFAAILAVVALAQIAAAQQPVRQSRDAARIEVVRTAPGQLRVDVRLHGGVQLEETTATLNGAPLVRDSAQSYPGADERTSVLFLIDTSDPARQPVIDRNVQQIGEILKTAKPHHRFGLAVFDSDLTTRVAPGAEAPAIAAALADVRAAGRTTELYRSVISAITRLGVVPATRRAVFLFSDGLAEDTAYKAEDVVAAARAANVAIFSFGFARTPAQSVALQNIRRLSEDTGGQYVAADPQNQLPASALAGALGGLDAGGTAVFALSPDADSAGGALVVRLTTTGGPIDLQVDLPALPVAAPPPSEEGWRVWLADRDNQLVAALAAVFAVGVLILLLAALRRRRRRSAAGTLASPQAWLESLDGDGRRIAVFGTAFRIGRNRDNDLVLANDSVSGHHAVIHRSRDGTFSITDLKSVNGVLVNLAQVPSANLASGDLVELGEARFRFRAAGAPADPAPLLHPVAVVPDEPESRPFPAAYEEPPTQAPPLAFRPDADESDDLAVEVPAWPRPPEPR